MVQTERTKGVRMLVLLVGAACWLGVGSTIARGQTFLSPLAVAADNEGKALYIAEHDASSSCRARPMGLWFRRTVRGFTLPAETCKGSSGPMISRPVRSNVHTRRVIHPMHP